MAHHQQNLTRLETVLTPGRRDIRTATVELLKQHHRVIRVKDAVDAVFARYPGWRDRWERGRDYFINRLRNESHDSIGLLYDGELDCLYLRRWFERIGSSLLANRGEAVCVKVNGQIAVWAAVDTALRLPFMKNKKGDSTDAHAFRLGRGKVIEHAVSHFIQRNWPLAFEVADNATNYTMPCGHDFKLKIGGKWFAVDVAGTSGPEFYGAVASKPSADLHIAAAFDEDMEHVWVRGWCLPDLFKRGVKEDELESIDRLVVRLNADQDGIDWMGLERRFRSVA